MSEDQKETENKDKIETPNEQEIEFKVMSNGNNGNNKAQVNTKKTVLLKKRYL